MVKKGGCTKKLDAAPSHFCVSVCTFNLLQYVVIGAMAMAGAERACCSHAPATTEVN